jgi:hypothetical protein
VKTPLKNFALTVVSIAFGLVLGEALTRVVDGRALEEMPLVVGTPEGVTPSAPNLALANGVSPKWFFVSPPPLPNRAAPPAEWQRDMESYRATPPIGTQRSVLLPADMFKAWNSAFTGDACSHPLLSHMPSRRIYSFDPADGAPRPAYRYMPNATTPVGLVTNEIGWRGPPLRPRKPNTVRIIFVGASTTSDSHDLPYSYPELIDHWLRLWAASKKLDVDFQALNAGRESMISSDIAAIMRTEVAPMRPDLVVYYGGGNEFDMAAITRGAGVSSNVRTTLPVEEDTWLARLARYSALALRVKAALSLVGDSSNGREAEKPAYTLVWPPSVNEADPDLADPNLPINLPTILRDLDGIRTTLRSIDAEFALSSFVWLVKDGMVVDPMRGRNIWIMLNRTYWPWRYRDIERLVSFQNRVFEKYAATNHLPFIDVAREMPFDPGLFSDALHNTANGVRVRAWVVLQTLIPLIEDRLARGVWPKGTTDETWPTFAPRSEKLNCPQ